MKDDTYDNFRLQELITRREAMIAINQDRSDKGLAQAYGEEAFVALAIEIREYADKR